MKKVVLMTAMMAVLPTLALATEYRHERTYHREARPAERSIFGIEMRDNTAISTRLNQGQVANVQRILKNEGFYRKEVDGAWGHDTVAALIQFQRQNDLKATGRVDAKTREKLNGFAEPHYFVVMDDDSDLDISLQRTSSSR